MSKRKEAYIVAMMRSPFGRRIELSPQELSRQVLSQLFSKNNLDPKLVDYFAVGSAISLKNPKQATHKEIAMLAGMENASSESLDKACSSGLVAIHRAAQSIWHEGADLSVAGGVDIMSADRSTTDSALTDPSTGKKMYQLADEFADEFGLSKLAHDSYSAKSYKRALKYRYDTGPRAVIKMNAGLTPDDFLVSDGWVEYCEDLATNFESKHYNVIKGCKVISNASSSKPADGAAFMVLASPMAVRKLKLKPLARFTAFAQASGSRPKEFVSKPVTAIQEVLKKNRKKPDDIDYFLVNEAFATTPLCFMRATPGVFHECVNPRGGALAFGHPLGASGVKLGIEAVHILNQEQKERIIVSLCNATDEATAGSFERV